MENKILSSIAGGLAGTAVITACMFLASLVGMPDIDYGNMLAIFTHTTPLAGWIMHFMMGTLLAFVYVYFFREFLPGPYAIKGMIFSVLPWVLTLIMLFPMVDQLMDTKPQSPGVFILSTMIAYLAFGLVMGAVAKPHAVKSKHIAHA
jgi:hypothetical protein